MRKHNIYIPLDRAVIKVSGDDASKLLQGIISNDIEKVSANKAIYTYQLTPQGKYLFDYFISQTDSKNYLIDIASIYKEDFLKRLKMYKLRSKVTIEDKSEDLEVASLIGPKVAEKIGEDAELGSVHEFCKGHAFIDPRNKVMDARAIIARDNEYQAFHAQEFELSDIQEYHKLRIENNIPEGEFDLTQDKSYPLQFRMREISGVNFEKGCYVGQEVTARTHHTGVVRKQTYIIKAEQGINVQKGEEIIIEGRKLGQFLSSIGNTALALLGVEFVEKNKSFEFGEAVYNIQP